MVGKSDRELLQAMCDSLVHRGPDDEGMYLDTYAAIGVRRLSIIDLETGHQPIPNENETMWVVNNGEIYNYKDIRSVLEKKGYKFRTNSDTEVIIHAYEEYGDDCVQQFNGDFAFAIWDVERKELFAARDRIGVKPFYYWQQGSVFLFGSEIKAILQDRSFNRRVNVSALYNYLSRLSVWGIDSIFEGIKRLPPGHTLRFKDGQLSIKRYWDFDFSNPLHLSEEEYAECIYESFCKAVKRRLIADVPLGAFLSGGVDSSSIVAVMSELSEHPVKTFSFGFEARNTKIMNELHYAKRVADYFGTDHHEFVLDAKELIPLLPKLLWHFDEPFAGTLPQYFITDQANDYVKVALCGSGGDELFGDYGRSWWFRRYLDERALQYSNWPSWMKFVFAKGTSLLPNVEIMGHYRKRANEMILKSDQRGTMYADGWDAIFTTKEKATLCQPWMLEAACNGKTLADIFQDHFIASNASELMDQVFYVDMKTQLVDEYCYWTDFLSMASSVEARVPFLDHEFIELVISIPANVRSRKDDLKYLFRRALNDRLPEEIFTRPKGGLSLPLDDWLRNGLRSLSDDMLSKRQIQKRGYFNPDYVSKLLTEHVIGSKDHTYRIWVLMMFELWHRIYIDDHVYHKNEVRTL